MQQSRTPLLSNEKLTSTCEESTFNTHHSELVEIWCQRVFVFFHVLQNELMELNKYKTLPGKLSKKSEQRAEMNGDADGEYLSPVRLSPVHGHDQDYSLSELLRINIKTDTWILEGSREAQYVCVKRGRCRDRILKYSHYLIYPRLDKKINTACSINY